MMWFLIFVLCDSVTPFYDIWWSTILSKACNNRKVISSNKIFDTLFSTKLLPFKKHTCKLKWFSCLSISTLIKTSHFLQILLGILISVLLGTFLSFYSVQYIWRGEGLYIPASFISFCNQFQFSFYDCDIRIFFQYRLFIQLRINVFSKSTRKYNELATERAKFDSKSSAVLIREDPTAEEWTDIKT